MSCSSLLYTALEARKRFRALEEEYCEDSFEDCESSEEEEESEVSSMYESLPREYKTRIRRLEGSSTTFSLEQITEDEEESKSYSSNEEYDDSDERRKQGTVDRMQTSVETKFEGNDKRATQKSRKISTAEMPRQRSILKIPQVERHRPSVGRTESQNRADFLLKMMARGGDYRSYRCENNHQSSISLDLHNRARKHVSVDMV